MEENVPEMTQSVNNKESVIKKPRSEKQKEWARQLGQNSKRMKEAKKAKQMEQLQSQTKTMREPSTHIQSDAYKTKQNHYNKVFPTLLIFSITGGIIYYLYKKKTSTKQTQEINKAKVHKASHDQGLKQPPVAQLCSKQSPVASLVFMQ